MWHPTHDTLSAELMSEIDLPDAGEYTVQLGNGAYIIKAKLTGHRRRLNAFAASCSVTGTQAMVKLAGPRGSQLLQQEAVVYSKLKDSPGSEICPSFLQLLEFNPFSPIPYLVLSACHPSLTYHLIQNGPLGSFHVASQLLVALARLHSCGVFHLAVKPENITYGGGLLRLVNLEHSILMEHRSHVKFRRQTAHQDEIDRHYAVGNSGRNADPPELWHGQRDGDIEITCEEQWVRRFVSGRLFGSIQNPAACDLWCAGWTIWYAFTGCDLFGGNIFGSCQLSTVRTHRRRYQICSYIHTYNVTAAGLLSRLGDKPVCATPDQFQAAARLLLALCHPQPARRLQLQRSASKAWVEGQLDSICTQPHDTVQSALRLHPLLKAGVGLGPATNQHKTHTHSHQTAHAHTRHTHAHTHTHAHAH